MSISDEIKKQLIESLRGGAGGSGKVSAKELEQQLRSWMDVTSVQQPSGGSNTGQGRFTLTIHGLRVSQEIMTEIWRRYRAKTRQHYEKELVSGTNKDKYGVRTATGQTLGRMLHPDNTKIEDNRLEFQFPQVPRKPDKGGRKEIAEKQNWVAKQEQRNRNLAKRKKPPKPVYQWNKIQRGPKAGKDWAKEQKPKQYNEVPQYIAERKGKPIFLSDVEQIKDIVVDVIKKNIR